ncbi:hypothetical protein AAG906_007186 [Vitis piasezkii]
MRRLDDLEVKGVQEVQIVNEGVTQLCLICKSIEHGVQSCPTLPAMQDMFSEQSNALGAYKQYSSNSPYSNTYNPVSEQGNRFQGNQTNGQQGFQPQGMPSQNFQQQPQISSSNSSLEDMMREFIQNQDKRNEDQNRINAQTSQELVDIQTTLSQLAASLSQEKGNEDIPFRDEPIVEKNARNEKESEKYEEVIVSKDKMSVSNHLSFPSAMQRHKVGDKTLEILEILKQVKINIPLLYMIKQVFAYAKFLKDLCTVKKMIKLSKKAFLTKQVSAIIENKAIVKYKDPDSFVEMALLDLGVSVNLLPYSIYKQLGLGELKATTITLSLAYRSIKVPRGVVEDVLVQVEKFYYLVDFVVLDTESLKKRVNYVPIILGRPFLATANQPMNHDDVEDEEACLIEALLQKHTEKLIEENIDEFFSTIVKEECIEVATKWKEKCTIQSFNSVENDEENKNEEVEIRKPELKPQPHGLKYVYLEENEEKLVNKRAIGWSISDLKGINPLICTHHIYLEENAKPVRQPQRRLNPLMQDVVRNEVLKLLNAGIIYPISNSSWVSPTQVVPKKSGITMVKNDEGELIPTRKLNAVTKKYHFPLPFLDQVLETVAGHDYYCFLDGYSGYFQIAIALKDREKTTFTCPFGTYAYRHISFGFCNVSATFQRCMLSIFSDMVERIMKIFMDDLTFYGKTFHDCLLNLKKVLKMCIEKDLVLNWKKCHFMATSGVVLDHIISREGIQVDPAKIEFISKLHSPTTIKEVRQFLGHAGFYRRFIQDFSKIFQPLCVLLLEDAKFIWTKACQEAFERLKSLLTTAPIVRPPNWSLPFELMCDASDYAMEAIPSQKEDGKPYVVYYASKTLNDAQKNYTTTENELLVVVFALDIFKNYLLGTSIIIFTDHLALKYLLNKNDAKSRLIRWILLLQEFNIQIKDKQGFPNDALCAMEKLPWFANIINYLATGELPSEWNMEMKKYFLSRPFSTLLHKYGVRHKVSTPYHPQTNGQAELENREIKRILTKVVNTTRKDWSSKLSDALRAYRTAYKTILGMSSYHTVYGKACHLPVELEHRILKWSYECLRNAREKHKFYHDKLILQREFKQGENVLLYDSKLHIFLGKLRSRWNGPYVVKEAFPYGTMTIRNPRTSNEFKVNGQCLKHFMERFETQEENLHFLDGDVQKG